MASEVLIQVAVRVRPLLGSEASQKETCVHCVPNKPQIVLGDSKTFTYDYVLPQKTSQKEVYDACVKQLVSVYFEGYNTTVFAYGQTGTGKTYTMATGNRCYLDDEQCGIIPRAIKDIFSTIENISDRCVCKLRVSFIEVYMEELKDLLNNETSNVQVMDDENGNTVMKGVHEEVVENLEQVLDLLDAGTAMRHVGSTNMNEESSRSHCIFTMILDQYPIVESVESNTNNKGRRNNLSSRFHFVDLAGSERYVRTGNTGERFKESISINSGLLALGNVISALSERNEPKHIPYRQSKLTRLLKDSLGGNSKTLMITCLSPSIPDLDENINSLNYAARARKIRNTPKVNFDIKADKINQMATEIEILRGHLQKRQSTFFTNPVAEQNPIQVQKINDLEVEQLKRDSEHNIYLQQLHEVFALLKAVEMTGSVPSTLKENIENWLSNWEKHDLYRPITAPNNSRSAVRRPQNDILENLRSELSKCQEEKVVSNCLLETKNTEVWAMQDELIKLKEQIATLNMKTQEYQEKMMEQQLIIEGLKNKTTGLVKKSFCERRPSVNGHSTISNDDRVMHSFRAKSALLISQMDDMDVVEIDENISDEESSEVVEVHWDNSSHELTSTKTFTSLIPRLSKPSKSTPQKSKDEIQFHENGNVLFSEEDPMNSLESNRVVAREEVRTAEIGMRQASNKMKDLEQQILLKEKLIQELMASEKEAHATTTTFANKLSQIEKECEKSQHELEEAQEKINQFEKTSNKDAPQKNKLEAEFKKKYKEMEKKYAELKAQQTNANKFSGIQENNEKRIKELEAGLGRTKNQHIELDRKLKEETEKKSKFEQEVHKYEIRIKELELKTDQQQKLLKRKNEEVVAAQRKLRIPPDNAKEMEEIERKRILLDEEMDKIVSRQKDIDALEDDLRQRDVSLKKRENLIIEKEALEVKRARSSHINLSKSIMQLSLQVEHIDEKMELLTTVKDGKGKKNELENLEKCRKEMLAKRDELQKCEEEEDELSPSETRRLIELGEAIEAVDEAIAFRNDLIAKKQISIDKSENLDNTDRIIDEMGEFTSEEYKHLLHKQILKIIELRLATSKADDARCDFELKISEQQHKIHDLNRLLQVNDRRHEKMFLEQNSKYEKDIQFLMEQLRHFAIDSTKDDNPLEKKVNQLEKELHYYKNKSRKLIKEKDKVDSDQEELKSHESVEINGTNHKNKSRKLKDRDKVDSDCDEIKSHENVERNGTNHKNKSRKLNKDRDKVDSDCDEIKSHESVERNGTYHKNKSRKLKDRDKVDSDCDEMKSHESVERNGTNHKNKSRKLKDRDKVDSDHDEVKSYESVERNGTNRITNNKQECSERKGSDESVNSNRANNKEFRLPNISSHQLLVKKDSEKKLVDHHNAEDAKRLQKIFESKTPSSPSKNNSHSRRNGRKKPTIDEGSSMNSDTIEISGSNPWNH